MQYFVDNSLKCINDDNFLIFMNLLVNELKRSTLHSIVKIQVMLMETK